MTYGEDADENTEEPESVPTGYETFLTMYSLDFEEFLWAEGYENATPYLKELFDKREKVPSAVNDKYEQLFRRIHGSRRNARGCCGLIPKNHDFTRVTSLQEKNFGNYRFDISSTLRGAKK